MEPPGKTMTWCSPFVIRRCVGSKTLACGCLVGVYELFNGKSVAVVDDKAKECEAHTNGRIYAMSSS
jgi:hypothetical protein